jgi:hypothetical protein
MKIGGLDETKVQHMSGGFEKSFELMSPSVVSITINVQLSLATAYEPAEFSEVLFSIDGNLVRRNGQESILKVAGGGGGGNGGMETITLDKVTLTAGPHKLVVGGYNNAKSWADEITSIFIGFVQIDAVCSGTSTTTTKSSFDCALPVDADKYSVITSEDASIGAHSMYKGLAIGGTLLDATPRESGTVDKTTSYVKVLYFKFNGAYAWARR